VAFSGELVGDAGTVAARSPPARWLAEDEPDCTALGDAWPDGVWGVLSLHRGRAVLPAPCDWGGGCFQGCRGPHRLAQLHRALGSAAASARHLVVLLKADTREKLIWKEAVMVFLACSRQEHP